MSKLNPKTDTKAGFAARVSVTKGRVSQLISQGLPVQPDGRIDIEKGLAWIEDNLDPVRRGKGGTVTGRTATLAEAKRLHEIVKVQRAKLAYEREKGELIDASAAERTVFARAKAERDAHIAWVQRSAPIIASELKTDVAPVFTVLDRLMREHLEHLAETPLEDLRDACQN